MKSVSPMIVMPVLLLAPFAPRGVTPSSRRSRHLAAIGAAPAFHPLILIRTSDVSSATLGLEGLAYEQEVFRSFDSRTKPKAFPSQT
jgi:hypothetical protein